VPAIRHVAFATREVATFVVTLSRSQATAASESKQNVCAVRLRLVDGFVECDSHLEQQQQRNDALHLAVLLPSNFMLYRKGRQSVTQSLNETDPVEKHRGAPGHTRD
jgi:hypothetical protein